MSATDFLNNQPFAKKMLEKIIRSARPATAYLFVGPEGCGKGIAALQFAKALNCEMKGCNDCNTCRQIESQAHPDVKIISLLPDKNSISIEQMREVQRQAYLKPFMAAFKIYIIRDAEKMQEAAANSLLKILEEPPGKAIFILTASSPKMLIPTITSRCQCVRFINPENSYSEELIKKGSEILPLLESDSIVPIFNFNQKAKEREDILNLMDALSLWYRDIIFYKEKALQFILYKNEENRMKRFAGNISTDSLIHIIKEILDARHHMLRNVNPRLVFESLMLELNLYSSAVPAK